MARCGSGLKNGGRYSPDWDAMGHFMLCLHTLSMTCQKIRCSIEHMLLRDAAIYGPTHVRSIFLVPSHGLHITCCLPLLLKNLNNDKVLIYGSNAHRYI